MTLDELKGLTPTAAIAKVAEFAGVSPSTIDGQWRVESNRGTHPTMTNSKSSAKGHFQFIDKTHATWEKRLGAKLDRFDFHDALFEYGHQMKENMAATKGNEADAVRMFYRGPDRSMWGDADVADYTGKVFNKNVPGPSNTVTRSAPAAGPGMRTVTPMARPASELFSLRGVDVEAAYKDAEVAPATPAPVFSKTSTRAMLPPDMGSNEITGAGTAASTTETFARQKAKDDMKFGSIYETDTLLGAAYNRVMAPTFDLFMRDETPADPAFVKDLHENWTTRMAGMNEAEQDRLADSKNQDEFNHNLFRIQERRQNDLTSSKGGTLSVLGADLMAGVLDPTTWATGIMAGKAFAMAGYGANALARSGRPVAAALSAAGENVVGNVAWDAAQEVMGEHKSVYDYALSAATGLIPSVISSPLAYREGTKNFAQNILDNVAAKNIALHTEAVANLGPSATPDVIRAEVSRIEAEQIKSQRASLSAAPPEADRMDAPNLDEFVDEAPAAPAAKGEAPVTGPANDMPVGKELSDWNTAVVESRLVGVTRDEIDALPAGVQIVGAAKDNVQFKSLSESVKSLADEFLPPGYKLAIGLHTPGKAEGVYYGLGNNSGFIALKGGSDAQGVAVHELGHAIMDMHLSSATPEVQAAVKKAFADWTEKYRAPGEAGAAARMRSPQGRNLPQQDGGASLQSQVRDATGEKYEKYFGNFDEYGAEQFAKYIEAGLQGVGPAKDVSFSKWLISYAKSLFRDLQNLFKSAKDKQVLRADARLEDFFQGVRKSVKEGQSVGGKGVKEMAMPVGGWAAAGARNIGPQPGRISGADWDLAQKYHLDLMPQVTPREKAEFKATVDLYRKAESWVAANPRDDAKIRMIGDNSLVNVALPATLLATSDNPVARMVAGTLLEQSTGAQGRRATAALAKVMLEEKYIGNTISEYDRFYRVWRNENGGGVIEDFAKNKVRENFNKAVMLERENRLRGVVTTPHPMVKSAADSMDAAFERARLDQVDTKVVGWARLPDSSVGYTPHQIAAARLQEATPAQLRVFTLALAEQFKQIEGWSADFSDELARKYLDHARVNANGGHEIPANVHNPQAASMVKGALEAMGMDKAEVAAMMGRYAAGGPSHTKKRVHLDLTTQYPDGEGGTMTLMSLFNTDQVSLLRSYSRRVSGEVALAQHGVMGAQGMTLIRRALEFGPKVELKTMQAFDQVAAELLDKPFGTAAAKWMDRVMTMNATARLGGMGFTQLGESLNGIWHVGVGHTMSSIKAMPRLRGEVAALARGDKVSNGILSSMEVPGGGGEFGLEGYKLSTPFDSPEQAYNTYGHDASGWFDRVLRGAAHAQGTLSMHRMIQAVQVRGMAEQITLKALRFIKEGGESKALADMGFTPDMVSRLKADLPNMVVYDAAGRVKEFDITKASDAQLGAQFNQAVRRGAGQIIQRSYIGEQGKWAHDGLLRLLTQFRSYPLVAMEKQWGRQKGMHGALGAMGILLGSMAAVVPIYYARVALNAVGRDDGEAYMEKALDPMTVARASLNYVGVAGMSGDLMDALSGLTGMGESMGGRTGANKGIVGSVVPSIGYIDDLYKAAQNPSDPHKLAQTMPFSRTPMLIPLINGLRDD